MADLLEFISTFNISEYSGNWQTQVQLQQRWKCRWCGGRDCYWN